MSKNSLIAKQALKIDALETLIDVRNNKLDKIHQMFISVGGPLNDNKLDYSREQQSIFHKIISVIEN